MPGATTPLHAALRLDAGRESTACLLPSPVKTSQPLPLKARLLLSILPGSARQGSPGSTPAPASPLQFLESDPSTEHEFPPFNKHRRVTWASRMLGRRDPGQPRGLAAIPVLREPTVYGRGQTGKHGGVITGTGAGKEGWAVRGGGRVLAGKGGSERGRWSTDPRPPRVPRQSADESTAHVGCSPPPTLGNPRPYLHGP